jgi:hypothetical protein
MVSYNGILATSQTEQVQKNCRKGLILTSHIMPKSNFRAIINLKSSVYRELPLAPPDILSPTP